jgi:hypothetical protein
MQPITHVYYHILDSMLSTALRRLRKLFGVRNATQSCTESGIYLHKMQPSTSQMQPYVTNAPHTPPYTLLQYHFQSPDTNVYNISKQHAKVANQLYARPRESVVETGDRGVVNRFASVT